MGKKGSWFSAVKRFCTSNSKEKAVNEAGKKDLKEEEKKKKKGLKHGSGNRSFIPLFREPSSIEKILGEVDQQKLFVAHPPHHYQAAQQPPPPPPRERERERERVAVASSSSPPKDAAPPSPRLVVPQQTEIHSAAQQHSATRIQAAYRGYMARRKVRGGSSAGLVRLQGVVKGQHVKRQTVNAMKQMQLLVRLQTQIQSQRMQTIENQAAALTPQPHTPTSNHQKLEMGDENWDDSLITKEERESRLHRKMEALNKRERVMAYAYSHQLWKATPKSAQNTLMGYPWWWNWLDRELPTSNKNHQSSPSQKQATTQSPQSSRSQKQRVGSPIRPSSSRSMAPSRTRQLMTPSATPPSRMMKFSKTRGGGSASASASPYPLKDDDSLMSCPPFSLPNYMSPTVSAKAKARPTSNPRDRDRLPGTPGSVSSQRRFSFPATPNSRGSGKSVGDLSLDSAFSIGRKPFNRFV